MSLLRVSDSSHFWSEVLPAPNVTDKRCVSADSELALPEPFSSLPGDLLHFAGIVITLTK